ncbi:MAG: hypothetical protein CMJ24_11765 [Phycisphaerae bacterium]|nr:hypothetical protein [Phycisphaerae bacterium]
MTEYWNIMYSMQSFAMNRSVSPRELSKAIGISESSLKRWADQGLLSVTRTGGGHRRITLKDAISFIRHRSMTILDPAAIGLPAGLDAAAVNSDTADDFLQMLQDGCSEAAQQIILSLFMSGMPISEIGDSYIKYALQIIGDGEHTPQSILVEHRATQICVQVLQQIQTMIKPSDSSYSAVGCSLAPDPYMLPSMLVASVFQEHGAEASNIGPNTPLDVLRVASVDLPEADRPDVAWLSVSTLKDGRAQSNLINEFAADCSACGIKLVIGGRNIGHLALEHVPGMTMHASLQSVSELAASIAASK